MENIAILWVELPSLQLVLDLIRHHVELFDVIEKTCFIKSFYIFELKEAKSGHLLIYLLDDVFL